MVPIKDRRGATAPTTPPTAPPRAGLTAREPSGAASPLVASATNNARGNTSRNRPISPSGTRRRRARNTTRLAKVTVATSTINTRSVTDGRPDERGRCRCSGDLPCIRKYHGGKQCGRHRQAGYQPVATMADQRGRLVGHQIGNPGLRGTQGQAEGLVGENTGEAHPGWEGTIPNEIRQLRRHRQ